VSTAGRGPKIFDRTVSSSLVLEMLATQASPLLVQVLNSEPSYILATVANSEVSKFESSALAFSEEFERQS
jgi:hypothetical protein